MSDSKEELYCPYSKSCFECCLETEMMLSKEDIKRIKRLGYKKEEFLEEKEGFLILKNIENHCFFLKKGKCSIYAKRPKGCRFYPLIYDFELEAFTIDNDCAYHQDFNVEAYSHLFIPLEKFLNIIIKERNRRKKKLEEKHKGKF